MRALAVIGGGCVACSARLQGGYVMADRGSGHEPARGLEKIICIVAIVFCAAFVLQVVSAGGDAGLSFYLFPVLIAGFAIARLKGWLPGGVARGGGGGP